GNDVLTGTSANETFTGGAGDDKLIGGGGTDTAIYAGLSTDYAITMGATVTIKDLQPTVSGNDGTDTLTGIAKAQFSDRTVFLDGTNNAPIAVNDTASTNEDTIVTGKLFANDIDFDGHALSTTATTLTSAQGAVVTIAADGSYSYDPRAAAALQALNTGQSVVDSFGYTVNDGHGGTSAATVAVTVAGVTEGGAPTPSGDTLTFHVAGDIYQAAPQFTVSVDGTQVGGPYSVTASHSAGQWQDVTLTGNFGSGAHSVVVNYINDVYDGVGDRNLYVDYLNMNGTRYEGEKAINTAGPAGYDPSAASMFTNGTLTFSVTAQSPSTPPPTTNTITGTNGKDILYGQDNVNDTIDGKGGNDTLYGRSGDDVLKGGAGSDALLGEAGNDRLDGGAGNDALQGGPGNDVFVFGRGYGQDLVSDFTAGQDKIDLSAFGLGGMDKLSTSATMVTTSASSMYVDFGNGDRLTISGISKLTADHVIF
ncbi:MAG TPA: carbohydrate-binding domain-containing protein, partial [Vicinamibacterales bacterium]